jgi:hypothetical protein
VSAASSRVLTNAATGATDCCSAFRLFGAANMLKHELQQLTFAKQKTLRGWFFCSFFIEQIGKYAKMAP